MDSFTLPTISNPLQWKNEPVAWTAEQNMLHITAGAVTDWFINPQDNIPKGNAPLALFSPRGSGPADWHVRPAPAGGL